MIGEIFGIINYTQLYFLGVGNQSSITTWI